MSYLIGRRYSRGYIIDCPECGGIHRHEKAGPVSAVCGATYVVVPDEVDHGQDRTLTRTSPVEPWATI